MMKTLVGDRLAAFIELIDKSHADYSYSVMLVTVACYSAAALCRLLRLYEYRARHRQAVRRRGSAQFQRAFLRHQHSGILAPLAYEPDPLAHRLSVHATVDVAARLWPSRTDRCDLAQHDHHRPVARFHAQLSRFRRPSGRLSQHDCPDPRRAHATEARRGKTNQAQSESWAWRPCDRFLGAALTFALMSFSMIFFHSPTWDQAISVLAQILGFAPSGSDRLVGYAGLSYRSRMDLHGHRALCRRGRPGARRLSRPIGEVAPPWLQYGVCLFLLYVLSTAGSGTFHIRPILTPDSSAS